jgi:hypothetical protein
MRVQAGPFSMFGGFVGSAVITMVLGALPMPYSVAMGILAVFVFAWSAWGSLFGAVSTLVCAALFADGFLLNKLGRLRWNGRIDAEWLAVLVAATLLGLAIRYISLVLRYEPPVHRPVPRTYVSPTHRSA